MKHTSGTPQKGYEHGHAVLSRGEFRRRMVATRDDVVTTKMKMKKLMIMIVKMIMAMIIFMTVMKI